MFSAKTRDRSAAKGDEPTGVNGQADAMKQPIHCFRAANHGGNERQGEMECHAGQGGNADGNVPFGHDAVGEAIE